MAFAWSTPKLVTTRKDGRKVFVRSSPMAREDPFWEYWNNPDLKPYLKKNGIAPAKGKTGWNDGQVNHWIPYTPDLDQVNAATGKTRLMENLEAFDKELSAKLGVDEEAAVAIHLGGIKLTEGIEIKYV